MSPDFEEIGQAMPFGSCMLGQPCTCMDYPLASPPVLLPSPLFKLKPTYTYEPSLCCESAQVRQPRSAVRFGAKGLQCPSQERVD